ncbi:MAG: hypothetical protein ACJAWL_000961 [Motiliproteus sp.]|jgi:hypothetical protein
MINIGTADFYLGVPSLPAEEFESYSTRLFDEWEVYVGDVLKLPDYYLALDVQEGSISAKSKIIVTTTALCGFLATYGSISSGVKHMYADVRAAGNYLGVRASAPFPEANVKPKIRNRGEALSKLQSLFIRVGNGSISVEEAMTLAEKLLGDGFKEVPEFMEKLKVSLENTPSQMLLPIEGPELQSNLRQKKGDEKKPANPKPRVQVIRPDQYRVEIWRESKRSKRNVRIRKV